MSLVRAPSAGLSNEFSQHAAALPPASNVVVALLHRAFSSHLAARPLTYSFPNTACKSVGLGRFLAEQWRPPEAPTAHLSLAG